MTVKIYGLLCPITNGIRYVGQSLDPKHRYREHLLDNGGRGKAAWITDLLSMGRAPILVILEGVAPRDADAAEQRWIDQGRAAGWELTNLRSNGRAISLADILKPEVDDIGLDDMPIDPTTLPQIAEATGTALSSMLDDEVDEATARRDRIEELNALGYSRNEISRQVFGHKDDGTLDEIRAVLGPVKQGREE